jgi:hypothetical protein
VPAGFVCSLNGWPSSGCRPVWASAPARLAASWRKGLRSLTRGLNDLARYSSRDGTQRVMQRVGELWVEYRIALSLPFNDTNLQVVNYLADDLMIATGKLTMKIESEADNGAGRLLDLSLRQNMLAQRLARLTLMAQTGDRSRGRAGRYRADTEGICDCAGRALRRAGKHARPAGMHWNWRACSGCSSTARSAKWARGRQPATACGDH